MSDGDLSALLSLLAVPLGGLLALLILWPFMRWTERKDAERHQKQLDELKRRRER